ncbi:hypothetical protein [Clostridium sp. LP20]|uniref:hypothetical protein n=1 Tax=Clostridium sp. LP20 TaxID=3418665 RepID=UPI003EE4393A
MKVFDYMQQEVREVKNIKELDKEYELTYNNEVVRRNRYEFRELKENDKVYKCIKGFLIEVCDGDGFTVEDEYIEIENGSIWFTPEDKDYRFIGGEIRLESNDVEWIEITKEHLEEYFKEVN